VRSVWDREAGGSNPSAPILTFNHGRADSRRRLRPVPMQRRLRRTDSSGPRALILYAALACLCVSDGIGPRLIPFPASAGPHRHAFGAGQPRASDYSAGGPASPAATAPPTNLKLSRAGDAFKKIPVFSAPDFALPQATPLRRAIHHLSHSFTRRASLRLRFGRAPPVLA
jgi:hypothetical protein